MLGALLVFVILIIFIIVIGVIASSAENNSDKKIKLEEFETKMQNNGYELSIENGDTRIYLNKKSKMWTFAYDDNFYKFKDVLACEILEDDVSIVSTTSKKHVSVGKALIGNVLLGPAGAIIGGTSGKTASSSHQSEICKSMRIKITLKNLENPCVFIELISKDTSKQSEKYKKAFETGQKIVSLFQVIINKGNEIK